MNLDRLTPELRELINRSLAGLAEYREHVVIVGGLAKFFYPAHPDFHLPDLRPRATVDVDVALDGQAQAHVDELHRRLTAAHLVPYVVLDAEGHPIEQQYQLEEKGARDRAETCLEFLVPWHGPKRRRTKPHGVQPSALRYVDLLLERPLKVEIKDLGPLLLPHPLSYVIQKTLIRQHHRRYKAAGDQADLFFAVWGFQPAWAGWGEQWRHLAATPAWKRWLSDGSRMLDELHADATATGNREVAEIHGGLGDIGIEAATVSRIMRDFLRLLPGSQ
jgi:hypothetical protein